MRAFKLIPFPVAQIPSLEITGRVARQGNLLSIHYLVRGDIESILLPVPSDSPTRKHDLWQATCFEFFLAIKDQRHYWEFNLSPSGEWNAYHMDAYRRIGFREETTISNLPFEFTQDADKLSLDFSVGLTPIIRAEQTVQVGITAILQTTEGNETYWALAHPGQQADFHLRESFMIEFQPS